MFDSEQSSRRPAAQESGQPFLVGATHSVRFRTDSAPQRA
jgi:hypothetical protein